MTPLDQAVELLGLQPLARLCEVSYQAVRKWQRAGRLPRTEWTGETDYATRIERATEGKVTRSALLAPREPAANAPHEAAALLPSLRSTDPDRRAIEPDRRHAQTDRRDLDRPELGEAA